MSFKGETDFEDAEKYMYDEMYYFDGSRVPYDETQILYKICRDSGETNDSQDPLSDGFEDVWDTAWDYEFDSFPQLLCTSEVEVLSVYLAEEDEIVDVIRFKNPENSIRSEPELEPYEPISLDTNLLSEAVQVILSRPLIFSSSYVEDHHDMSEPLFDTSRSNFTMFNSVEAIMNLLGTMPSIGDNKSDQSRNSSLVLPTNININQSSNLRTQQAKPVAKLLETEPNLHQSVQTPAFQFSMDIQESGQFGFNQNCMSTCQQRHLNLYPSVNFGSVRPVGKFVYSKSGPRWPSFGSTWSGRPKIPIMVGRVPWVASSGLSTRKNFPKLFDPGIY